MRRLADPTLVVLVGPSAAGKSAWAAAHFTPDQVVSSDRLRAMVGEGEHDLAASKDAFTLLDRIVAARVGRRLTTVVDTLGLDPERRQAWRELARRQRVSCVAVAFDTEPAECRRRNAARAYRVPAPVLSQQLAAYAETRGRLTAEGFDEVLTPEPVRLVPQGMAEASQVGPPGGAVRRTTDATGAPDGPPGDDETRLRFGLQLSSFDAPGGAATLRERVRTVAEAAEAAGFDSIWVMDHFRQLPQLGRPWADMLESTTTLGYLAAATTRMSVGALVHGVTYRNVGLLAKAVATLDVLTGGRAWCGLGAGNYEAEHLAYGWPFPPAAERLALLEEALQALPLLWGPGTPAFSGQHVQVPEAMAYPRPLNGRVPVLVGGSGERRTLRLAAQYADACNLFGDAATVRSKVSVLHRHCAEVGRDPAAVQVTHLSTALVAGDVTKLESEVARRRPPRRAAAWAAATNPGTVEDHLLRVRALREAGVQHLIVSLVGVWDSPAVERFGEVIAAVRSSPR